MFDERDDLIDDIARELRDAFPDDAAARARVMAAVRRDRARATARTRAWTRWWGALRAPRTIRVSPLAALAAAAAAGVVVAIAPLRRDGHAARGEARGAPVLAGAEGAAPGRTQRFVAANGAAEGARLVQFVLVAPGARRVALAGDFNGWNASTMPLAHTRSGVWSTTVPLAPGRHVYAFVVDDSTWMPDPTAARAPRDDFGNPNSVIVVGGDT